MSPLRLFLFGAPRVEHHNRVVALRRSKALALLAYVAVGGQPQQRDTLLALLWPEFAANSARNNLRRELSLLKGTLPDEVLVADRAHVARNPQVDLWLDVAAFQEQIARTKQHDHPSGELCSACAEALETAARLYTDDFMAGFSLPDSPAWDEWQFLEREALRQQWATVLHTLTAWHRAQGTYAAALPYARRWLALDQLNEGAHRELMRLYAWTGQHAAALRQYDECVRWLDAEVGVDPQAETKELYYAIKARRLAPPSEQTPHVQQSGQHTASLPAPSVAEQPQVPPASPRHNLPPQTMPFVGRAQELAVLHRYLASPQVRLITIVGAGGMGKTRLAIAAAARHLDVAADQPGERDVRFSDGVFFVPLAALSSADHIAPAIVDALAIRLEADRQHAGSSHQQVLDYLSGKRLLLILDNFEHLLDGADLVAELLQAAPSVAVLVTSRERLYLREEHLLLLKGLDVAEDTAHAAEMTAAHAAGYAAMQLFAHRAQQVQHTFALTDTTAPHVAQICRLVEGMPLAVELAASWVDTLRLAEITAEIQRNLDFLETDARNIPVRHRSMRAVFDATWQRLHDDERAVFAKLSIFHGGFGRDAAQAVTGASVRMLARLVNKSLVRMEGDGRYQIHELLRQYGSEQREQRGDASAHTHQAHSAYYIDFLAARLARVAVEDQTAAVAEILAEQDNVRAAWQWATAHCDLAAIGRAGYTLAVFYEVRGRYREGAAALELAIESLRALPAGRERDMVYAARLVDLGWLLIRLGDLGPARTVLEESHALSDVHHTVPLPAQGSDPWLGLGMVALLQGQYAEAARLGNAVLERTADARRAVNRPRALFLVAKAAHAQGDYRTSRRYAEEALAAAADLGHQWLVASLYYELGNTLSAMGEYREAAHHYQTYSTLREAFDDHRGMALALLGLGRVALRERRHADARTLFERGLAILRQVGAQVDTGFALDGLAAVAVATDEYEEARRCLAEALQLALATGSQPLLLWVLLGAAQLLLPTEKAAWGPEAVMLVLNHPACDHEMRDHAHRLLNQYERMLAPSVFAAATHRGQHGTLRLFTAQLEAILELPVEIIAPATLPGDLVGASATVPPLIEPLTEREQEVMQLLAEGLSNQEIADRLIVAIGTVKWYTRQIYGKLGVQSRTQAIAHARHLNLLT